MANPEVDSLISELGGILEQNRQKRNAADMMLLGIQQGKERAAREHANAAQLQTAVSSGYGKDKAYSLRGSPPAGALSPSIHAKGPNGRIALAEKYARGRGDELPQNPYTQPGGGYQFLKENDTPAAPPQDAGALDEAKKRFTQNLMLSRGESGGPLGGAGSPGPIDPSVSAAMAPKASPADAAALQAAGNPDTGNFGHMATDAMNGVPPQAPIAAPPAAGGMPQDDYALLSALGQRYMSPEELARGNPR